METILQYAFTIYVIISIICLVVYLPRIYYYIEGFKKPKTYINDKKNKLCVLVPARNESSVIKDVLNSLTNQSYDKNYYDIHVIVKEKDDPTIPISKTYTNTIVHIISDQSRKGDALDGALQTILKEDPDKYDAYIIVDADNVASVSFLEQMNNGLASGRQIILGKKLIKNHLVKGRKNRNWISNCSGMTYTFIDTMGNAHRSKRNIPLNMCGTGMLIRSDVIKDLGGWPYRSLIEDFELLVGCTMNGYTSMYYEPAHVYTEESVSHRVSVSRRMRWIAGFAENNRLYRKQIIEKSYETGRFNWKNYDFLYGAFPLYIFFGFSTLFIIVNLVVAATFLFFQNPVISNLALSNFLWSFGIAYGISVIYTLIGLLIDRKTIKMTLWEKIVVLFLNPIYMSEYVYIFVIAFTGLNDTRWKEIKRVSVGVDKDNF
jgi:cellulose synthase/poly-beta-1,6-N-acetylglucosamine synthase-like glycosyltransferase